MPHRSSHCRPDVSLKVWLVATSALTASTLVTSRPVLAQACGPLDASGSVTCNGTFGSNIDYPTDSTPIHLTLGQGVIVNSPGGNAVNAANTTGITATSADISIAAATVATITNTTNGAGNNNTGLRIQSSGNATITAINTTIDVNGTAGNWAILAFAMPNSTGLPHAANVIWSGPRLSSAGVESGGIQADNRGIGNAIVEASGNVTVNAGTGIYGLLAHSGDPLLTGTAGAGDASVLYHSGTINLAGSGPRGILAWTGGDGSTAATTEAGTVINTTSGERGGPGVYVFSASAASNRTVTATIASEINAVGPATFADSNRPNGIRAFSGQNAPISVTYAGPRITTSGGNGVGIIALSGGGTIDVTSSGSIATNGTGALGIYTETSSQIARFATEFPGASVYAGPATGATTTVSASGPISTVGAESHGIWASSTNGSVVVNARQIVTTGQFSAAVHAEGTATSVNIATGGSAMGGWQADVASVGSIYGLPAAGVVLSSTGGAATLTNNGSIGALSDRAVLGDPVIFNNGTMTGFVTLVGQSDYHNNGSFNLRHFADTNGDGARDTLRVAVSDLGGPGSTFENNGTLSLQGGPGATTLDSNGQYLPHGNANNSMALGGPAQGQILGVSAFTNSGAINLQSNPVAGDVLVISGGTAPGEDGSGTFTSNGGSLLVDTRLDEGGPNALSDVLVVDGTAVGAAGPTRLRILNAGGAGALTIGNGIPVVEVIDDARSVAGAFVGAAVAGPYEYALVRGGFTPATRGD